ncbi:MAG: MlaE family lipid ABC transporter permease subunit [Wenzhouxiangella sp.]|nr:MAG: MlaE family lipid ABC transporter permease subunit [Wenzhouxiangella sp.]
MSASSPQIAADPDRPERLRLGGAWLVDQAVELDAAVARQRGPINAIDASGITRLDAAGAMLLLRLAQRLEINPERLELAEQHHALVEAVARAQTSDEGEPDLGEPSWRRLLAHVGRAVADSWGNLVQLLAFLGQTLATAVRVLPNPRLWRPTATVHHMEQTGLDALPLVALLSFLIGAVVAFLGATVLKDFGAELFVVDLVAYAFLREMGVLLTAILLAGRTASAFTAQIGTMKSREEIDAMRTLGLDPVALLVIPRLTALLIMLPLLAVFAMLAGLLGGMLVAVMTLGIPVELYISRVYESIELRHYLVGLIKAPLFALVIALVGCMEGFKVGGTAQSVGERTTSAVVQSITLVIVINALAAVFFMEIGW